MIYICAGMKRSGSTWQFNVVRLILKRAGAPDIAGGYVGQMDELLKHETVIVKLHQFDYTLANKADVVLTAHRDLRDVAASLKRHYSDRSSLPTVYEWVTDHMKWSQYAAYDTHYENLLVDKLAEVKRIAGALRLSPQVLAQLPYDEILNEIEGQKFKKKAKDDVIYDSVNLLHEGHITDGRHGSWVGIVPPELVAEIEKEFRGWMVHNGYLDSPLALSR